MFETDYPHGDGTWPDTQALIGQVWGHLPDDEVRAMCCENAARLFRIHCPTRAALGGPMQSRLLPRS